MKLTAEKNAAGGEEALAPAARDILDSIADACFRFRAISVVPVILITYFVFAPLRLPRFGALLGLLGFLLALAGAATRFVAVGFAGPFTSGRENYLKADSLNTRGLYSIVRNPLYVGNFLIYNGILIAYASPAALALFNAFFIGNYYFIIRSEERYLEGRFGSAYSEYLRAVPRVLPRFGLYKANDRPFSLARAVFKEKNTTFYWTFFFAVSLLVKQYKSNDGAIERFWWHAVPVLVLFALNLLLTAVRRSKPA